MHRTWTTASTLEDQKLLDQLFVQVAPTISDVVTTLLHQGRQLILIGALFERAFDGKVSGGVGHRAELARRVLTDGRFVPDVSTISNRSDPSARTTTSRNVVRSALAPSR